MHCSEDREIALKTSNPEVKLDLFGCVVCLHVVLLLRKDDVEDSMGAAAGLVHVGRSYSAGKKEVIQQFLLLFYFPRYCKILQIYTSANSPGFVP